MKKCKKVILTIPIYLKYTEKLSRTEYQQEIKAVKQEILKGAREYAYSVLLKEGKIKIQEVK